MATNPISSPLPADLPTNWVRGQTIAPAGPDVGLAQQYGYNYLMAAVNAAQNAANTIGAAFEDLATQEDIGDFYTKTETVSSGTKTSYGLQSTAIPDNLFAILANAVLFQNGDSFLLPNQTTIPITRIITGSYTGTGTYGQSNPNSIALPFPPKIGFVVKRTMFDFGLADGLAWVGQDYYTGYQKSFDVYVSGNTFYWYSTGNAGQQLNLQNDLYFYAFLG